MFPTRSELTDMEVARQQKVDRIVCALAAVTIALEMAQEVGGDSGMVAILALLLAANLFSTLAGSRAPAVFSVVVLGMDSFASFYEAWAVRSRGADYLHFAYVVAGLGFLVAMGFSWRRLTGRRVEGA